MHRTRLTLACVASINGNIGGEAGGGGDGLRHRPAATTGEEAAGAQWCILTACKLFKLPWGSVSR